MVQRRLVLTGIIAVLVAGGALTGGLIYQTKIAAKSPEASGSPTPTDYALADYAKAAQMLDSNRPSDQEEAARLIDQTLRQPLIVTTGSGRAPAPQDVSISSQLLTLTHQFDRLARETGEKLWRVRARRLAEQALASSSPTLEALLLARSLDAYNGRAEIKAAKKAGKTKEVAELSQQETNLRRFYESHIFNEVKAHWELSVLRKEGRRLPGDPDGSGRKWTEAELQVERNELASRLILAYAAERERILD